ncbi:MAG: DUF4430 domain-containing protein [Candidatus Thorarchaeota archaeon]
MMSSRIPLLLVFLLAVIPNHTVGLVTQPQMQFTNASSNISLEIDFGNGTTTEHVGLTGNTVLNVTESEFEVEVSWYGNFAFVESIAGVTNDQGEGLWWQYWVNDEYGPVAANVYEVQDGDAIIWRYTSSQVEGHGGQNPDRFPLYDQSTLYGAAILAALGFGFLGILYMTRRKS